MGIDADAVQLAESERVERLERVAAIAASVWENEDDARAFMNEAHPSLDGLTPLKVAKTELGAQRVELLLLKLKHNLPT